MAELNISLKDYLKNVLKWKAEAFSKEGEATLSIRWRSFESTLTPWQGGQTSFIYRRLKRLRLAALLSKVNKIKLCPDMLKELQDPSSLTPEVKAKMSDKDLAEIEFLSMLMKETGQNYQTALEYFTEKFQSADAAMDSLFTERPYLKEDINDFPYGEWMKLHSFNTSLKSLPAPYICLEDNQFRKWYLDIQVLMRTESVFIDGDLIGEEAALSFFPFYERWLLNRKMKSNQHPYPPTLVQEEHSNSKNKHISRKDKAMINKQINILEEKIRFKQQLGYDVDEFLTELIELRNKL